MMDRLKRWLRMKKLPQSKSGLSLTSFVLTYLKWMLPILLVFALGVGLISWQVGPEQADSFIAATTALLAVVVAVVGIGVAVFQVEAHIRPFVTVARIEAVVSPGPLGELDTIPYEVDACYIHVQNTGSVPAENVSITAKLVEYDPQARVIKTVNRSLPLLPPNVQELLEFPEIPHDVQPGIHADKMDIDIVIDYGWLGSRTDHIAQSFHIRRAKVRQISGAHGLFVFIQRERPGVRPSSVS